MLIHMTERVRERDQPRKREIVDQSFINHHAPLPARDMNFAQTIGFPLKMIKNCTKEEKECRILNEFVSKSYGKHVENILPVSLSLDLM